jgi:hypothetical protein
MAKSQITFRPPSLLRGPEYIEFKGEVTYDPEEHGEEGGHYYTVHVTHMRLAGGSYGKRPRWHSISPKIKYVEVSLW